MQVKPFKSNLWRGKLKLGQVASPLALQDGLVARLAVEGVHLADARQVVVLNAEVALTVVEPLELLVADGANEAGLFEVGVDVVVELVLSTHGLLADVAEEAGTGR